MKNKIKIAFEVLKFPLLVLLFQIVLMIFGMYGIFEWLDIPMHILGGFSIALSGFILIKILQQKKQVGKMSLGVEFLFVVSLVALVAVLWEFAEFTNDFIFPWKLQPNLPDTLVDLSLGILGGASAFLFKKTNGLK